MDARTQRILRQHVQTDALLGVSQVPVGAGRGYAAVVSSKAQPQPQEAPVPTNRSSPPPRAPRVEVQPPPAAPGPLLHTAEALPQLTREQKITALDELDTQHVQGCSKCDLCESRKQTVFGVGDPDAALMFIGEGPGQQ